MRQSEHSVAAPPGSTRRRTYAITPHIGDAHRERPRPTPLGFFRFAKQATDATSLCSLVRRAFVKNTMTRGSNG